MTFSRTQYLTTQFNRSNNGNNFVISYIYLATLCKTLETGKSIVNDVRSQNIYFFLIKIEKKNFFNLIFN